jgi:hypothetical protein
MKRLMVLVGTRKGAFTFTAADASRRGFKMGGPHHFGHLVYHLVQDPREPKVLLCAARTGHLGPTVFRSTNLGKTWTEAKRPPAFEKAPEGTKGRVLDHVFWLTPGHPSQRGVWYAGSSPQGLFRSEDGGVTWDGVAGLNRHPDLATWTGGDQDGTPDGPKLHSIIVDPRDAAHLYLGMSGGGVFESLDAGASWRPFNRGVALDFFPEELKDQPYGHDPHCVVLHPARPDRLYQQNHCGIYRVDRPSETWERIGRAMPKSIGDVGFPIVVHPRDPDTAWVIPMDGTEVWPRTSIDGKPAVYRTRDAGKKWERQDTGLPRAHAWFTVKRQAFAADGHDSVGLYFGTTGGELWASRDEGKKWTQLAAHLPHIYSVTVARLA